MTTPPAAAETAYPRPGDPAPDLTLPDQHGDPVTLSEAVRDRAALLVFFPFAFSSICTAELLEIQLDIDRYANERVQVHGISCDPTYSLRAWAAQEGYRFPLLSDFWPHGVASSAYGVFDEQAGLAVRGVFVVDRDMSVRWSRVHARGEQRPIGLLQEAVAAL